ncbi:hypothetical protein [Kurthia sp. Dielmo]|uniref:hypothetical protein n=1 Tax=Kurthia sp. Dielmo TaxID=1033738 RepID=UPI00111EEBDE|nr:hypothetical protein [Kurthia sp. Dielmo]
MKKYLIAAQVALGLTIGGMFYQAQDTEAASNSVTTSSTWSLYYIDYTYTDGWYAKWYINHSTGQKKKETYMANGKLYSVKYY